MDSRPKASLSNRRWIIARRVAIALWLVLGFVIWNVVFDAAVAQGARDYLTRKILHEQGKGPGATIHGVMDGAVARGARTATEVGGGVSVIGLALVWMASRRRGATSARGGSE